MTAAAPLTASMRGRAPAPCTIRIGKPDDLAFVVDSWVGNGHRGERKRTATAHVRALLARPEAALYVAHVPGAVDEILGYALLESGRPACLHWVYVRSAGRRLGIAGALLSGVAAKAIEYSRAAPSSVRVPAAWKLNEGRAKT